MNVSSYQQMLASQLLGSSSPYATTASWGGAPPSYGGTGGMLNSVPPQLPDNTEGIPPELLREMQRRIDMMHNVPTPTSPPQPTQDQLDQMRSMGIPVPDVVK